MTEEQYMNARRIPARINARQVAWELKLKPEDLSICGVRRLVPPLNDFAKGVVRYWAAVEILSIKEDRARMIRITREIYLHWRNRGSRRRGGAATPDPISP